LIDKYSSCEAGINKKVFKVMVDMCTSWLYVTTIISEAHVSTVCHWGSLVSMPSPPIIGNKRRYVFRFSVRPPVSPAVRQSGRPLSVRDIVVLSALVEGF